MSGRATAKPLSWVPSLYLAEALPFSAVMLISVIMFKDFGLGDAQITLYTGWMGLPWVVKPLWCTVVDNLRTKRWWIVGTELTLGVSLALVAFSLPTRFWLQGTLALFFLIAFASATHDISADGFYIIGLGAREQELFVGVRNTFYRVGMVVGQGGLVMLEGFLVRCGGLGGAAAWAAVFVALALLMLLLALYHGRSLPRVETARLTRFRLGEQARELLSTLTLLLRKPNIVTAALFILLFRLPEGLLVKVVPLFLTRSAGEGGLALSNVDFGLIYGTLSVIGLLLGGILGGWLVSRYGLRRCLWPLVLCLTVPDLVYVFLSLFPTHSLWTVGACVCLEQTGYGLGFAAYTLFLVAFSRGERSTAVFSICTAGQYLGGVLLPSMLSGLMSEGLGYRLFFVVVALCCLITFAVTALVRLPEE
ncbi:MAG: MFS transporter [Prevotellaceae bacterium]|nr:MFS transporter [Prevotellaceae bacterium]